MKNPGHFWVEINSLPPIRPQIGCKRRFWYSNSPMWSGFYTASTLQVSHRAEARLGLWLIQAIIGTRALGAHHGVVAEHPDDYCPFAPRPLLPPGPDRRCCTRPQAGRTRRLQKRPLCCLAAMSDRRLFPRDHHFAQCPVEMAASENAAPKAYRRHWAGYFEMESSAHGAGSGLLEVPHCSHSIIQSRTATAENSACLQNRCKGRVVHLGVGSFGLQKSGICRARMVLECYIQTFVF